MVDRESLTKLQAENSRLIALLESHGIAWQSQPTPVSSIPADLEPSKLNTAKKVTLFRQLFRGMLFLTSTKARLEISVAANPSLAERLILR